MLWTAPLPALLLVLLQWGLGRWLLRRWPLADETWLERSLLQLAAGFLATTLLLFALASVGLYQPVLIQGLFWLLLVLVGWQEGRMLAAWVPGAILRLSDEVWTPVERAALPALLLSLALFGFYALAPTTTWDPLDYHYELPRLWLAHGGFDHINTLIYANFPSSVELHFGWLMALHSDLAANQYTVWTFLWLLLSAAACGVRWCSRPAAVLGLLAVTGLPMVYTEQVQGGIIDCALGALMLTALWAGVRWWETRQERYFWAAAVLTGGAISIKHSGWMIGFYLGGLWLLDGMLRKRTAAGVQRTLLYWTVAFALGLPWYLKSFIYTGNPVWPFADHLFNGTPKHYADILYWSNPNFTRDPADLLTWWWEVTTRVDLTQYRFRLLTPVYLGLLPLVAGLFLRPGRHLLLLGFCAFQIGALLYQAPGEPRYMLPAWTLLGILLAAGGAELGWLRNRVGSVLLPLAFLGPLAFTLALLQIESRDRLPFIMGREARAASYARRIETMPAIEFVEERLQPGELVLHGDPRVFMFRDPASYRIIYPLDYPALPSWERTPVRLLREWHMRKVRFVTLSAGAHYMGLTRATLLTGQKGLAMQAGGELGLRSSFATPTEPPEMFIRQHGTWVPAGPLPDSPLGPLHPRTLELGAFTTREITQLQNPRVHEPPAGEPNYVVDLRGLQARWTDIDVRIVLAFNDLISRGALVKVLDHAPCPVFEVVYPESWGPPGTSLREGRE